MAKNPRLIDMTGKTVGLWTVLRQTGNTPRGMAVWRCRCACGEERDVRAPDLRSGKSVCCGCQNRETIGALRRTHGQSRTRLHRIWQNMKGRCRRPQHPQFKDYGGRGINICDEWLEFTVFRDWALAHGYRDDLSIERQDVNGGYCPSNCTWAGADVQSANRRYTIKDANGELFLHIARRNGISRHTYSSRVHKQGWDREKAATTPVRGSR